MPSAFLLPQMVRAAAIVLVVAGVATCGKNTPPMQAPAASEPPAKPQAEPLVKPPLKWINLLSGEMNTWLQQAGSAANALCGLRVRLNY